MDRDKPDDEDPFDLFDTSLSLIFSIPPIAFSPSSSGLYTYTSPNHSLGQIELAVPSPPADLYKALQANHVWLSSVFLADQLSTSSIDVKGKRVAELGAGAGLPGIVACKMGGRVMSSDWDTPEVIRCIKENFERSVKNKEGGNWAVLGHTWGTNTKDLLNKEIGTSIGKFDILLLADTLWMTDTHSALLDSVFDLLSPTGVAHIAAGLHTGRGPVQRFKTAAEARGADLTLVKTVRWVNTGGWEEHESPEGGLEEERGVVVYFTLSLKNSPNR